MKRFIKIILIGLALLSLPILSSAQDHIIDDPTKPQEQTWVKAYNYIDARTGLLTSMDSIHVSSADIINAGNDSIPMLQGDVNAAIMWVIVDYTAVTTAYTTTGSSDTTFIYTKTDVGNKKVAGLSDDIFDETVTTWSSANVSTPGSMSESCLFWLKFPTSKYSLGDGYLVVYYGYIFKR